MEFSGAKRDDFKIQRLEPVNESGGSALLNMVKINICVQMMNVKNIVQKE